MTGIVTWLELSEWRIEWKDMQISNKIEQVISKLFCKGPINKHFRLSEDRVAITVATTQLCLYNMKVVLEDTNINENICVPILFYW